MLAVEPSRSISCLSEPSIQLDEDIYLVSESVWKGESTEVFFLVRHCRRTLVRSIFVFDAFAIVLVFES